MFGCYGSLSVLLNLIKVTKLSKNILILGVDLNKPELSLTNIEKQNKIYLTKKKN